MLLDLATFLIGDAGLNVLELVVQPPAVPPCLFDTTLITFFGLLGAIKKKKVASPLSKKVPDNSNLELITIEVTKSVSADVCKQSKEASIRVALI